jgi:predicted enzyme related to lactoylglutathione lyase
MFWKIGFGIEFALIIIGAVMFMKINNFKNEGAVSWTDIYSQNPAATVRFLNDAFGVEVVENDDDEKEGTDRDNYTLLKSVGQMAPTASIADVSVLSKLSVNNTMPQGIVYFTVNDYADSHLKIVGLGAKVVLADNYAGGAKFGIYTIPGGVNVGIVQWEYVVQE